MTLTEKRKPFWLFYYSLPALFGILAIYLFISLFDKNLFCGGDGWLMQYTATDYARMFWSNVFHGNWTMVDFTVGEGMDPWVCMAYYGLTDPMSLIFGFTSHDSLPAVYNIVTLAKLFLSGLAFGWYASTKSKDDKAVAIGALVYTFAGFFMLWLFCPGILSTGYLFPLLLYAMDRAFDKKKYVMFAGLTFFAYVTNYYAGMVCSMMLMVYAIIRILCAGKYNKETIFGYLKIVLAHALGICCTLFVILPIASAMMGGSRNNSAGYSDSMLWFNVSYYLDALISMFTPFNNSNTYWGAPYKFVGHFICIAVPALVLFLSHKTEKHSNERILKWSLFACALFICVPFFSKVFNLWMYPTHRWIFALNAAIGMTVVWAVPRLHKMTWQQKLSSTMILIGSAALSFMNMYPRAAWATLIAAVLCALIMLIKPRRLTAYIATFLSLVIFIFGTFVGNAYGAQFCFSDIAYRQNAEIYSAVELTDEELADFVRVAITDNTTATNTGILLGYNTTTASWNITPSSINESNRTQLYPNAEVDWWLEGWDDRTVPHALAGSKYFITTDLKQSAVPYGFEYERTVDVPAAPKNPNQTPLTCHVYVNQYCFGIGYMYENSLSYNKYLSLDIASKQLALMKYAIVESNTETEADVTAFEVPAIVSKQDGKITVQTTIPDGYEVYVYADKILQTVNRNSVLVHGAEYWSATQKGVAASTITTDTIPETQTSNTMQLTPNYVNVTAMDADGTTVMKTMRCSRPHSHLSSLNTARTLCLGHELVGEVSINLEYMEDILDVDGIKVYAFQTNEYVTSAQKLQNNSWNNVTYGENKIAGSIDAHFDGVFQLAVPYSSGWTAYVDGEEVEVFKSGVKYMGIELTEGAHEIRFEYSTPGLIPGTVLSVMFMMLLFVWFMQERGLFERMYTQSRNHKIIVK